MGSRLWLGKPASDLSLAEAAMLTALPQAPSRLRPDRHPQAAQVARDKVLDRMVERGRWTAEAVADAKIENVIAPPLRARWLAPLAAQRLLLEAGGARRRPGERPPLVASTLDADMQASVERMLLDRVDNLPPKVSMAVLVMDNDSLEIKAYAGSADFSDDSRYAHVDMVRGVRSPGSTLKPFLYAQALDEGLIHSESLLIDAPLSLRLRAGQFPGRFLGADQRGPGAAAVPECPGRGPAGPRRAGQFRLGYAGGRGAPAPAGRRRPQPELDFGRRRHHIGRAGGRLPALARGGLSGRPRLRPEQPRWSPV